LCRKHHAQVWQNSRNFNKCGSFVSD
jgi:hypothetical protein